MWLFGDSHKIDNHGIFKDISLRGKIVQRGPRLEKVADPSAAKSVSATVEDAIKQFLTFITHYFY